MLQRRFTLPVEQDVDDRPLRGGKDHRLDPDLPFVAAAVCADQLHPRVWDSEVEDAGVGGVGEIEADDLVSARG